MKKSLVALILLIFFSAFARAQSISLSDLTNLVTMKVTDASNFLTQGKPFKLIFIQDEDNGAATRHYRGNSPEAKNETVVIGGVFRSSSGNLLHVVDYKSTKTHNVLALIAQAKSLGLTKNFEGADEYNNIYIFDNYLFTVSIYIKMDNTEGSVEVKQKDYVAY